MATDVGLGADAQFRDVELACTAANSFRLRLRLLNESDTVQAFKVKTSAPKRWSVRPNGGVVDPGKRIEVSFKLVTHTGEAAALSASELDSHLILSAPVDAADAESRASTEERGRGGRARPGADLTACSVQTCWLSCRHAQHASTRPDWRPGCVGHGCSRAV